MKRGVWFIVFTIFAQSKAKFEIDYYEVFEDDEVKRVVIDIAQGGDCTWPECQYTCSQNQKCWMTFGCRGKEDVHVLHAHVNLDLPGQKTYPFIDEKTPTKPINLAKKNGASPQNTNIFKLQNGTPKSGAYLHNFQYIYDYTPNNRVSFKAMVLKLNAAIQKCRDQQVWLTKVPGLAGF